MDAGIPSPHGGRLVNLLVDGKERSSLKKEALGLDEIVLNRRQLCDFDMLATGVFSPLAGFMTRPEYESVLENIRLPGGELFPLPVCLDIPKEKALTLKPGQPVALRDQEGLLLAIMQIEEVWKPDREYEATKVYGTSDTAHPGVKHLLTQCGGYCVGGTLKAIQLPVYVDSRDLRKSPAEIRALYGKLGWKRVLGFYTRQPIHRMQFEITIRAMRSTGANLLCLPSAGLTDPDDIDHYTRVRCYKRVANRYPPNTFLLNLIPLPMRLAGPREALLHMIIARNFGCSGFIIGPDHASPATSGDENPFYKSGQACEVAEAYARELSMRILTFKEIVYLPFEDEFVPIDQVPKGAQYISMPGSIIKERIRRGKTVPEWATFPEVIEELERAYPPPSRQGFTIFLTGLSGAGKSTIAKVLYSRLLEIGTRPVTLLDGDIVRHNLSSELSFSKEHRDINVRRIGFVASEITKNRGIAICAPIAPYAATREEVRRMIQAYGGFFEVYVSTPIEECEKRDRKGMYAKARAGQIKGFTGVDDPYEAPLSADLQIDTTNITPDEAAQLVLVYLGEKGYI